MRDPGCGIQMFFSCHEIRTRKLYFVMSLESFIFTTKTSCHGKINLMVADREIYTYSDGQSHSRRNHDDG